MEGADGEGVALVREESWRRRRRYWLFRVLGARASLLQFVQMLPVGITALVLDLSNNSWMEVPFGFTALTYAFGGLGLLSLDVLTVLEMSF